MQDIQTVLVAGTGTAVERLLGALDGQVSVHRATDSDEVLATLCRESVDCLLAGAAVGEMTGTELTAVARQSHPALPVVLLAVDDEIPAPAAQAVEVTDRLTGVTEMSETELTDAVADALGPYQDQTGPDSVDAHPRTLFENGPDPIFIYTPAGEILDANQAACDAMDYTSAELHSMRIYDIDPEFSESELRAAWDSIEIGDSETFEGALQRADGTQFPIEAHVQKFEADGEVRLVAQVRDVTDREEVRGRLRTHQQALEDLHHLQADPSLPHDEKIDAILQLGAEYLGGLGIIVTHIEDDTQTVARAVGELEDIEGSQTPLSEAYCRKTIQRTEPLAVTNAPEEGWKNDAAYQRFGLNCYLGTALEVDGETHGSLCFASLDAREQPFTDEERTFLELIGQWLEQEMEGLRRERELRERERHLSTIVDNAPVILFSFDADGVFTLARGKPMQKLGFERSDVVGESVFDIYQNNEAVRSASRRALDGETVTERLPARGATLDVKFHPRVVDGDVREVVGIAHDITDLTERQQDLEREQALVESIFDSLPDTLYAIDPDGPMRRWNDRINEVTGYSDAEIAGMNALELLPEEDHEEVTAMLNQTLAGSQQQVESAYLTKDGERIPYEFTGAPIEDEEGNIVGLTGIGRDITDRKQYEQTLTSLHETTRGLVRSETAQEVCRRVTASAGAVLDVTGAATFLFDDTEAKLDRATSVALPEDGIVETVEPGEDPAWTAFVDGETVVRELIPPDVAHPFESGAFVPMGEHGVFVLTGDGSDTIDDRTVELAELLAANAVVALDRIEREQELRERDEQLRERAKRLERLDQVNERVREISHELVSASTRTEIEEVVCECLAAADRFEFAWIGEYDRHQETVTATTWSGTERGYLDAADLTTGDSDPEPAVSAAGTGEMNTAENVAVNLRDGDWRREAVSREFQSVAGIPLLHGGVTYGVLAVYADDTGVFDEETREVLSELGTTVAHAIRTVEQRQALLSDRQVELEFDIQSGNTTLFTLTDSLDCRLDVDRVVPQSEDVSLVYGTVSGTDTEGLRTAADATTGIDRGRVISDDGEGIRVELRVIGPSVTTAIADHGGAFQGLTAGRGSGSVTALFSASGNVGQFIDMFTERYPSAELAARREQSGSDSVDVGLGALTDRQQEVLAAALHSGFFEWPRESTGEEVAEALGISPPTFQEHLRRAERKIVVRLLDGVDSDQSIRPQ